MKLLKRFVKKYGAVICSAAILVAPAASEYCRFLLYEPEAPEGLDEFIKNNKISA